MQDLQSFSTICSKPNTFLRIFLSFYPRLPGMNLRWRHERCCNLNAALSQSMASYFL